MNKLIVIFFMGSFFLQGVPLFSKTDVWAQTYDYYVIISPRYQGQFGYREEGPFSTRAEAEAYRQQKISESGDHVNMPNILVIDQRLSERTRSGPSSTSGRDDYGNQSTGNTWQHQQDMEKERLKREAEKQKALEQEKADLLKKLKGVSSGSSPMKPKTGSAGELQLKPYHQSPTPVASSGSKMDVEQVQKRIAELQRNIIAIQNILRAYSRTLHGNKTEFETWASTVDEAYEDVLAGSQEYVLQMFIKYNLFGALERNVRKSAYSKLGAYLGSRDPSVQKWLLDQIRREQIQLNRLQKVVDVGNLSGDFASLLTGGPEETKQNMETLLFVNSLLETGEIVKYSELLKNSKILGQLPGEYFSQARMIGETYANLSAIVYSWYSINQLTRDVEKYDREIKSLSSRMRRAMKETQCLKGCLENPYAKCLDRCTGKTGLSKPPPLP